MSKSTQLFERAQRVIPGGVNSPVRAFGAVGGKPIFFEKAEGAYLFDADGKQYIDYVGSWGPMILGHAHPDVIHAVHEAVNRGLSFGAPCEAEVLLAEKVCSLMPNIEKIRMVNSGTEATMTAIRIARGFTQKDKIIKFEGCYHGHADHLLVKAGSGALTFGHPSSAGVPEDFAKNTLTATFNDLDSVQQLFENNPKQIAAIILEPVAGNMNCILPKAGFLAGLRALCDKHESVLIFDEVMTGFRVDLTSAQGLYQIKPDLTTLGKIIGGGMPVGAVGGRAEIMNGLSPLGPVYQAGTLSGNPVAMAAGLATLEALAKPELYPSLKQKTTLLMQGLKAAATEAGISMNTVSVGSMFGFRFTDKESIESFNDITQCDIDLFNRFFHGMLERGIYLAPSAYEAGFVSIAHSEQDLADTLDAARDIFQRLS